MFIAPLFTTAKVWKQPRCPTTINGLRKCIYTQQNFTQTQKKEEILSFAGKWIELENMLSEVSQAQKAKSHMFSVI
jgi:hypothetical protein